MPDGFERFLENLDARWTTPPNVFADAVRRAFFNLPEHPAVDLVEGYRYLSGPELDVRRASA